MDASARRFLLELYSKAPPSIKDELAVYIFVLKYQGIHHRGLRTLTNWGWSRIRKALRFLLRWELVAMVPGHGRSKHYFPVDETVDSKLQGFVREMSVQPQLWETLLELEAAQLQGTVVTQSGWIKRCRRRSGWSRSSLQRNLRRLRARGVVESMPSNASRQSRFYLSRLSFSRKPFAPRCPPGMGSERMIQEIVDKLMPEGADKSEREAALNDVEGKSKAPKGMTWLLLGTDLVMVSYEEKVALENARMGKLRGQYGLMLSKRSQAT